MSDLSKRKSDIFQESLLIVKGEKNSKQQSTNSRQDKFPGYISLVSIGYETMVIILIVIFRYSVLPSFLLVNPQYPTKK